MRLQLKRLDEGLPIPRYARPGDAGLDLMCTADVTIAPGERILVGTGIAVTIPPDYAGFVQPRSGLAAKHGLTIVNSPGLIDSGYRGEIKVCLLNTDSHQPIEIHRGDRIAQLVIQPIVQASLEIVAELDETERGEGGYGSSGVSRAPC